MGILSSVSEGVVSSILCSYLQKYSGPQCRNLRSAIENNVDLYRLWTENAAREGVRGPREVRQWTRMFPHVQRMMTPQNVKRWLREQGLDQIATEVERTEGGEAWLAWQVERFRVGLWGQ
jgi:hypothetical protein